MMESSLLRMLELAALWLFRWSWGALLLLGVLFLAAGCYRRQRPAIRHSVWLCGLIAVAVLPFRQLAADRFPAPPLGSGTLTRVFEISSPPLLEQSVAPEARKKEDAGALRDAAPAAARFGPLPAWTLSLAWLTGFVILSARLGWFGRRVWRTVRRARRVSPEELDCAAFRGARSVPPGVRIFLSTAVSSPILVGIVRPSIVVPADLRLWTTPQERYAMLQHELAHLARRDHLVDGFQTVMRTVLFFHPFVRYACRRLRMERELACDAWVLSSGIAPAAYAASLLKVAERSLASGGVRSLSFSASGKNLERRIEMILKSHPARRGVSHRVAMLLPAALMLTMVSVLAPISSAARKQPDPAASEGAGSEAATSAQLPPPPPPVGVAQRPPPPPPPPPAPFPANWSAPLPVEVTGVRLIAFLRSRQNPIPFVIESRRSGGEGTWEDLVVQASSFTFRARKGTGAEHWVYLRDGFEVEHAGKTYYGAGTVFLRQAAAPGETAPGIECWFRDHESLFDNASRIGKGISFLDLAPGAGFRSPPPPPPVPVPRPR